MKKIRVQWFVWLVALMPLLAHAGGDAVVVIYNTRVPESRDVAEYYAKMRHVPKTQVYGFSLTANEEMSREEFRDSFQLALVRRLEADGLWRFGQVTVPAANGQPEHVETRVIDSKIRYAVLCYGVPLKIAADPSLHEELPPNMPLELQRNEASVDSELAWLPLVKMDLRLSGPLPNWIFGQTNAAKLNPTNGILLVSRLDGPTPAIARGLVDKALQAETNGLWGRAYFDLRNISDTAYKAGDDWIRGASELAKKLGFETIVDNNPATFPASFPMSQIAFYFGWYTENVDGPFAQPTVEFMPGAVAYHLHSYSATTIRSTNTHWVGPFLAKGVTATMGCVNEPYLTGTPNPQILLGGLVAGGFTFGEAAWISQPVLSWQTTVVGDPLYRPFGRSAQSLHEQLERDHNPLVAWSFLRLINLQLLSAPLGQVIPNVENLSVTSTSAVLTEKLADLYAAQGKPSSAIETYQKALDLNPSPEQRVRLRLTLGEKLTAQARDTEAVDNYQKLLTETPDYLGKNGIEEKLNVLRQKTTTTNAPALP